MTTPAGWYPDPDGSGGQRYWDGSTWTEHRSPATPAEPEVPSSEQPTTVVPLRPADQHVGAHRAADSEPAPEPTPEPAPEPEPGPTSVIDLGSVPSEQATSVIRRPSPETWSEPASTAHEPPPAADFSFSGAPPAADDGRRKLIIGFGAACAALLAILVAVVVYGVFFNTTSSDTQASSSKTSTSKAAAPTTTAGNGWGNSTPSPSETPTAASGSGPQASDGGLTFAITGVDNSPTVQYQDAPVQKTAQGEFLIVHMTVLNSGSAQGTFLATLQKLKAGGTTYSIDDEATAYLNGTWADIAPSDSADVAIAFDVPPGTSGASLEVHGEPTSTGVDVPLS